MHNFQARKISGTPSIFLDGLRILAALTVFFVHAHDQWFPSKENPASPFGKTAHSAVIVFFVLSGYVIAHTTTSNNRGKLQYFQARLTRLWSVVLPALIVTAFVELFVRYSDPTLIVKYSRGSSWPRYILSSCFLNEIWLFSTSPPINVPLWSLGYEFWYYMIFGLWFYRKPSFVSALPAIIACLFVGPNILLMFPIWLLGRLVYSLPRPKLARWKAWLLMFLALILFCICTATVPLTPNAVGPKPFLWAGQFASDWVGCIFIAFALWLLPAGSDFRRQSKWITQFRKFADLTFPIYVLHYPLLILYRSIFVFKADDILQMSKAILSVMLLSIIIGLFIEKQRKYFSYFFNWLLNLIKRNYLKIVILRDKKLVGV